VTGVWDKGAENHNKEARISRATTATQRPSPAMKRRTNVVRIKGWKIPDNDNSTMIRENIANAFAISMSYFHSPKYNFVENCAVTLHFVRVTGFAKYFPF